MPQMGLEPTIPAFERARTVHTLDHVAAVIGKLTTCENKVINKQQSLASKHYFQYLQEHLYLHH
jgi:hypothetical protein